jgi:hypothetical protein
MQKIQKTNGGEMDFLIMILLFILGVFVVWVLTGGDKQESASKPFIKSYTDTTDPLGVYEPTR